MKLAEALQLRGDLQKRLEQLTSRLYNNATVQEGEAPAEDPAALLEEYLDRCQEELRQAQEEAGYYLRPRFSPGYGDFSIGHQGGILRMLDASKRIGLSMTDGNMLAPTKSVTAVIGLGRTKPSRCIEGCEGCGKRDCSYRRDKGVGE